MGAPKGEELENYGKVETSTEVVEEAKAENPADEVA
jgi:hypothetical protein